MRANIRCPIDWLSFATGDSEAIVTTNRILHHALITYTVPPRFVDPFLHRRFRAETFRDHAGEESALVSVSLCTFVPKKVGLLQRWLDPPEMSCVSYKLLVRDQVSWQRCSWQFATFLQSIFYSRIPRSVYGLPLFHTPVSIQANFCTTENKYQSYRANVEGTSDGIGALEIDIVDTGKGVLEPTTPVFEGFDQNESYLATIAYSNESVTRGEGNWLYRQSTLGTPFHPNLATLRGVPRIDYFVRTLGLPITLATPHSVIVQDAIDPVHSLQMEAHVEDDNEPHSGSQMPGSGGPSGGIHDRIQRKAMNRYMAFRDDLRRKVYAEKGGKIVPPGE